LGIWAAFFSGPFSAVTKLGQFETNPFSLDLMELTLKGLAKLGRTPALRRPVHRTQFAGPQDDPRGLSVLVYQPDLVALEGKLREVELLLHKQGQAESPLVVEERA
jgi:hypothetical protein